MQNVLKESTNNAEDSTDSTKKNADSSVDVPVNIVNENNAGSSRKESMNNVEDSTDSTKSNAGSSAVVAIDPTNQIVQQIQSEHSYAKRF